MMNVFTVVTFAITTWAWAFQVNDSFNQLFILAIG